MTNSTIRAGLWIVFAAALSVGQPVHLASQASDGVDVNWRNTLSITGEDFRVRIGGRIHADWAFFSAEDALEESVGELIDGHEFRRARLYVDALLYDRLEIKAQYDFAGGDADFKDVYMGIRDIPVIGGVRVGHFKEPFSLEVQGSSKYTTFLERGLPVLAFFGDERNSGFMIGNGTDRIHWNLGAFQETSTAGVALEEAWAVTGRVTGVPVEGEGWLLHLGASGSLRDAPSDELRIRARSESHLAPRFLDTGTFMAERSTLAGLEAWFLRGPASIQGEFIMARPDIAGEANPTLNGLYVYGSYFLNGGRRVYGRSGTMERSRVERPLGAGGGAVELALRFSSVDLVDGVVDGGKLSAVTAAVNWYLYSNARAMLNYVVSDVDGVGRNHAVQARFMVEF